MRDTLPYNLEAEYSLLGSLLADKDAWYKIMDYVEAADFYDAKSKVVFEAYRDMAVAGEQIDISTLSEKIESRQLLTKIGGRSFIVNLVNTVVTAFHIVQYAKIVKDKSLRRQLIEAQQKNEMDIYNEEDAINTVIATTQNRLFSVSPIKIKSDRIQSILGDLEGLQLEYLEKYKTGKTMIGYSSGVEKIDDIIDGLRPGHLWVIGGWHGTGKTSFALNIVHHALEQNVATSIVTLEMSQVDLTAKLIGIRHKLSSMKIIKGIHDEKTANNVAEGKEFFKQSNLEIHTEFDLEKIKMQIRKDVYTRGVKLVLVDYLQKISSEHIVEETPLISKASRDMSNLAQELGITILLVSQISNEAKKGAGAGAGFKGSGTIEASADLAIVLKRDKATELPDSPYVKIMIQITKNKFGFDGFFEYYMHLISGSYSPNPYGL